MNIRKIAQTLLTRRNQNTPIFNNAEMMESLGSDGYREALRRRWIIFTDDGMAQITNHLPFIEQLMEAANSDEVNVGDQVVVAADGKSYTASVQSKNANGAYTLSFGKDKPSTTRPEYRREEMQLVRPDVGANSDVNKPAGPSRNYPGMPTRGDVIPGVGPK